MGHKGGGFGATLVLAFVIVLLGVGLGVALSTSSLMGRIPVVGPLLSTSFLPCAGKSP
jgi:hypothetical protein